MKRASQVSGLILQGSIPAGSEFEKFVPLFNAASRWYTCLTGLVFTILAIMMLLPDIFQAMVGLVRVVTCRAVLGRNINTHVVPPSQ